jgi:adenine-specific DNA-methyltransferase
MVMFDTQAIDERRREIARATPAKHKSQLGQFMTPGVIANFMASMFEPMESKTIRLLDAGAGIGSLTAAVAMRAARESAECLECEAWEIDPKLHCALRDTLDDCDTLAQTMGMKFFAGIQTDDFILSFSDLFGRTKMASPTHAILNPPYKKISSDSAHRLALRDCGVETSNLYSAFVAFALMSLESGGELVAITPRSFCNGPYFKPFRALLLARSALVRIHVFESRTQAFAADDVLQENVIFHLVKGRPQGTVLISTSTDTSFSDLQSRPTPFEEIVRPADREKIFHLGFTEDCASTLCAAKAYCHTLESLGLQVSTGPVVDFRLRTDLRESRSPECVPLVYAHHFENGFVAHPKTASKKPNFIATNDNTQKWLMPTGCYALVRRLSSKEEKRRIVPAVFTSDCAPGEFVGFENHLNVFHSERRGLEKDLAAGLAVYLGSSFTDNWLRRFSGHTQVNASDLRTLRYPDIATLKRWGSEVGTALPLQTNIDQMVGGVHVED